MAASYQKIVRWHCESYRFFISDGTGITAGALGKLLEHFPRTQFTQVRMPFTDTLDKVKLAKQAIHDVTEEDQIRPVVIMSVGNLELRQALKEVDAYFIDLFNVFIDLSVKNYNKNRSPVQVLHTA